MCNETLTNLKTVVQENLGENNSENHLTEPSQLSNEIQVWTQIMEQKNDDKIGTMRKEMDNKLEAILKEVKSNKTTSAVTNPRSKINGIKDSQPSGFKTNRSIGVRASNIENSDSENDYYPLRASKMKDLKHPAKQLFQNESDVDITIHSNEESEVADYHNSRCSAKQIRRF